MLFNRMWLRLLVTFMCCVAVTKNECTQRTFTNAKVRICASKCVYQQIEKCVQQDQFIGDVTSVEIRSKVSRFRRGAFTNMPHLTYISGLTLGLTTISPGAFLDVPKIEQIVLTFNQIEEIQWGVFNNLTFEKIMLDWNSIGFIEEEAFSYMPNLRMIVFSRNKLKGYSKTWFKNSDAIEILILSYNEITKIWFGSFDHLPNLTTLDLSFNRILEIGSSALNNVKHLKLLDLTSNNLTALSGSIFENPITIDVLRIPLNRISFLSKHFLNGVSLQSISLHPNPWQCPCLNEIFKWIKDHNGTILHSNEDYRINWNADSPVCAFRAGDKQCEIKYSEDFVETQEQFFKRVLYGSVIREKPTSEPPNFDVLAVDTSWKDFSPL